MGPVAGQQQYDDITAAIQQARRDGARSIRDKNQPDLANPRGYFLRPTVFVDVDPNMPLWREEIFGPGLAVLEFQSLKEGLDVANASPYGLSSSLFTRNITSMARYLDGIETGLAHVKIHTALRSRHR